MVRNVRQMRALLGEGPAWDPAARVLWFVDIKRRFVHRYDPATDAMERWSAPEQVGWVLPADGGGMIAGLHHGPAIFDPGNGSFTLIAGPEPHPPSNRLNDATVAPDGSIWFGTMDDDHREPTGCIFRFDGTAISQAATNAVAITNGPAVSPDGRLLYHVDTVGGVVWQAPILDGVELGGSRVFARIDPADGSPDGVTVDSEGNVWLALWGGWRARMYGSDGSMVHEVRLPARNVTKIALGGENLRTAYITTAIEGLSDDEIAAQPEAGSLFSFEVDVPGQPLPRARSLRGTPRTPIDGRSGQGDD